MATKYILAGLAVVFAAAALMRIARGGGFQKHPQARIWLLIATIFGAVSAWLWTRG